MIKATINTKFRLEVKSATPEMTKKLGNYAAKLVKDRVQKTNRGSDDAKLRAYSNKTYYAPIKSGAKRSAGTMFTLTVGNIRLSLAQVQSAVKRGILPRNIYKWTKGRKSIKFSSYAAFKQALGLGRDRNMTLTGNMWSHWGPLRSSKSSVTVGFNSAEADHRAQMLESKDRFVQLSNDDRAKLRDYAKRQQISASITVRTK